MENIDIFDSRGTAKSFPINLIVSLVIISFLFLDKSLTHSAKILFTELSLSSPGQHLIVKLRKATCSELTKTSKIIDYINKGYDIKAKMNSKLDEIERISQERYEEYMSSLDSIYDYYRKLEL